MTIRKSQAPSFLDFYDDGLTKSRFVLDVLYRVLPLPYYVEIQPTGMGHFTIDYEAHHAAVKLRVVGNADTIKVTLTTPENVQWAEAPTLGPLNRDVSQLLDQVRDTLTEDDYGWAG